MFLICLLGHFLASATTPWVAFGELKACYSHAMRRIFFHVIGRAAEPRHLCFISRGPCSSRSPRIQGLVTSSGVVASAGTPQSNADMTAVSGLANRIPSSPSGSGPTLQGVNKAGTTPPSIVFGSPSIPIPMSVVSNDIISAAPRHLSILQYLGLLTYNTRSVLGLGHCPLPHIL